MRDLEARNLKVPQEFLWDNLRQGLPSWTASRCHSWGRWSALTLDSQHHHLQYQSPWPVWPASWRWASWTQTTRFDFKNVFDRRARSSHCLPTGKCIPFTFQHCVSPPHWCYLSIPPTSGRLNLPVWYSHLSRDPPTTQGMLLFSHFWPNSYRLLFFFLLYQIGRVWPEGNLIIWTKSHHYLSLGALISPPNLEGCGSSKTYGHCHLPNTIQIPVKWQRISRFKVIPGKQAAQSPAYILASFQFQILYSTVAQSHRVHAL